MLLTGCTDIISPVETEPTCDTTIPETWPVDGDPGVYHRSPVEFTLSEPDPSAAVIAEQTTRNDGLTVVYTPTDPLDPLTTYEVGLEYCRGTATIDFTTSELGQDLQGEFDLEGRVYLADFNTVRHVTGDGVADVISTFLGDYVLLEVIEASEHVLQLRVALAIEDSEGFVQDPCGVTVDLPEADFNAMPYFIHPTRDVELIAFGVEMQMNDFSASGTFAPDASWIGGIAITVTLDTRQAAQMLGVHEDDICLLAENVGLACQPCSDGQPYCGTLIMDDLSAEEVDTPVTEIVELPEECKDTKTG